MANTEFYQLRASWQIGGLFAVGGAIALSGAALLPLPALWRGALILLIAARFAAAIYRHGLRRGQSAVCAVAFYPDDDENDNIALIGGDGAEFTGAPMAVFVSEPLTVFRLRQAASGGWRNILFAPRRIVVLSADCLASPAAYRRLRVRLNTAKIGGAAAAAQEQI